MCNMTNVETHSFDMRRERSGWTKIQLMYENIHLNLALVLMNTTALTHWRLLWRLIYISFALFNRIENYFSMISKEGNNYNNNNNEVYLHGHKRELQHCKNMLTITKKNQDRVEGAASNRFIHKNLRNAEHGLQSRVDKKILLVISLNQNYSNKK